mmetsp:Transcript_2690/g.3925  ORF Transcript_2690/g.3925 Transcript_2690/m.3925 type:complete len:303 (+) Transcript_2690:206-1114(+)
MLLFFLLASYCLNTSSAFAVTSMHSFQNERVFSSTCLNGILPRQHPNDDFYDIDAARVRLEAMMGDESASSNAIKELSASSTSMSDSVIIPFEFLPAPPPLTTIARERRLAETHLLSQLDESDDALSDLWSLWFAERGPEAANDLIQAEELVGQGPHSWEEAEKRYLEIVEEHGIYWVEPVNRLATLMYLQGRLDESRELCERVLSVKPWHFGALSGIVMVFAALGDANGARQWAARRLPPYQPTGTNKRRMEWVERAIKDSHDALVQAEAQLKDSFGKPDERKKVEKAPPSILDLDGTAWQ